MIIMYSPRKQDKNKKKDQIKWFIDLDHKDEILYNNLYLNDSRILIKIPLVSKEGDHPEIRIQKFSITNIAYLTSY